MKKIIVMFIAFILICSTPVPILAENTLGESVGDVEKIFDFFTGKINLFDAVKLRIDFNNYLEQLPLEDEFKQSFEEDDYFIIGEFDYWSYYLYQKGNYKNYFETYMKPLIIDKAEYFIRNVYGKRVSFIYSIDDMLKLYQGIQKEVKEFKIEGNKTLFIKDQSEVTTQLKGVIVINKKLIAAKKDASINVSDSFDTWWISSDPSIATVYKGNVTAYSKGKVTITAWYVGNTPIKKTFTITIK